MSSLGEILLNAQSPDPNIRVAASDLLQSQKQTNPASYILDLSNVLASQTEHKVSRQLAGINLKNVLANTNDEEFLINVWDKVDVNTKTIIRNNTLGTLASEDRDIRLSASQAVAAIAKHDLPKGDWTDIVGILIANASNVNLNFRLASLMTMGYICEGTSPETLRPDLSNPILSSYAANISSEENNQEVKLTALKALKNSLQFAKGIMQNNSEREYFLNLIFQACVSQNFQVKLEGFSILCEIVRIYYDFISHQLQAIGNVTFEAISKEIQQIGVMALEVWYLIGEIELERSEQNTPDAPVRGYIMMACDSIVPLLLNNISRGTFEEDEWDISKACAWTLGMITQLTKDKCINHSIHYITSNLSNSELKLRLSSIMILSSILEGPSANKLLNLLTASVPKLITLMNDESPLVRETTAWAISRICEYQSLSITQPSTFQTLLQTLLNSLKDWPKIATHCCWALIKLIEHTAELGYFKANIFDHVLQELSIAATRKDTYSAEHNLELASYTAMSTLIEKSSKDCIPLIAGKISIFVAMLKQTATQQNSDHLQGALASLLSSCFLKISPENMTEELSNSFIEALIQTFTARNTVYGEGLQALGNFADLLQQRFAGYLQMVGPYLAWSLQKTDAEELCLAGTIVIGDIARALGDQSKIVIGDLISPLIGNLQNNLASSNVKVRSIESLADVASNTKEAFVPYASQVLSIIEAAANQCIKIIKEQDDPDLYEYFASLREAILIFYESFIQGLISGGQGEVLLPYAPLVVQFAQTVTQDIMKPSTECQRAAIGIYGDIADEFKERSREFIKTQNILNYIQKFKQSNNPRIRDVAIWASTKINSI